MMRIVFMGTPDFAVASLKALAEPEDEFIVFSPFFPEYRVFVEGVGAKLVVVESDPKDFQIDKEAFRLPATARKNAGGY